MSIYDGGTIDNQKPRKPLSTGSQKISLNISGSENQLSAAALNRKLNFAMEMTKFFPEWENQIYDGEENSAKLDKALCQYSQPTEDELGNKTATFGQVLRSTSYGRFNGTNLGGYTNGLEFYDKAGDYDHIKDSVENEPEQPVEELIDNDLWSKVQDSLKNEKRNYYELMMEGIDDKTPEEAFYLMTGMLESRTRILSLFEEMFGGAELSDEQKIAKFDEFIAQFEDKIDNKKLGVLEFALDTKQSFFSRILPMFGQSAEFYQSGDDQAQAGKFFNQLSEKVATYIGIEDFESLTDEQIAQLPKAKKDAILLWDSWLNPQNISAEQNVNPNDTAWGKAGYDKIKVFLDMLTQGNVVGKINDRHNLKTYKEKMQEFDEKKEEEQLDEIAQLKQQAKNKELSKSSMTKQTRKNIEQALVNRQVVKKENTSQTASKYSSAKFNQVISRVAGRVSCK